MQRTYRAVLTRGRIRWIDVPPDDDKPTPIHVTIVEDGDHGLWQRGEAMADALAQLAEQGGLTVISDPVEWQRAIREYRPLPGRGS